MDKSSYMGMFIITGITIWSGIRSILMFQRTIIKERNEQSEKNTLAIQALTEQMIKYITAFEQHVINDEKREHLLIHHTQKIDIHENRITILETQGH